MSFHHSFRCSYHFVVHFLIHIIFLFISSFISSYCSFPHSFHLIVHFLIHIILLFISTFISFHCSFLHSYNFIVHFIIHIISSSTSFFSFHFQLQWECDPSTCIQWTLWWLPHGTRLCTTLLYQLPCRPRQSSYGVDSGSSDHAVAGSRYGSTLVLCLRGR